MYRICDTHSNTETNKRNEAINRNIKINNQTIFDLVLLHSSILFSFYCKAFLYIYSQRIDEIKCI